MSKKRAVFCKKEQLQTGGSFIQYPKGALLLKDYKAKNIRNVVFSGHASSGKTSLVEAAYFITGKSDRLGTIAEGNTVSDFDPEEIRRKSSVSASIIPCEWKDVKLNIIDTPGQFDFSASVSEGFRAAGSSVIVISGKSGVSVGAKKAFDAATKKGIAKIFFVNKIDHEHADFYKVFEDLKATFGPMVCPIVVPYVVDSKVQCYINLIEYRAYSYENGKATAVAMPDMGHRLEGLRTAINEAVAETSEELMEKYFSGEEFTPDELIMGLATGVRRGEIAPVFCGSAAEIQAIDQLLNGLIWLAPWAETVAGEVGVDNNGNEIELTVSDDAQTAAIVFKTVVDPFVGKLVYFKVVSGKVTSDMTLLNMRTGANERIGKLYFVCGKKQVETSCVCAGDIGAVAKLNATGTGDTLCSPARPIRLPEISYELPNYKMAVRPKNKGEEEKLAAGLMRLAEEDPTITLKNNDATGELVLSGLGEQHLDTVANKLKAKFGVEVVFEAPKVAYRETIRKKAKAQGRHKKQSGGHGQFGDVWIEFEPSDCDGLEFAETVFGGAVPKNYFPAVEKGLLESAMTGVLAGYPMVGVKATLTDGSYHPVDSSELAFKTAASLAFKAGIPQANPVLLEPVVTLVATIPSDNSGDIMGDITKRRGRVLGMDPDGKLMIITAEVPESELADFPTVLRSVTRGVGSFYTEFARYEEVPAAIAQKIIAESKAE